MTATEKIYVPYSSWIDGVDLISTRSRRGNANDTVYVREDLTWWRPISEYISDIFIPNILFLTGYQIIYGYATRAVFRRHANDELIEGVTHFMLIAEPPRAES